MGVRMAIVIPGALVPILSILFGILVIAFPGFLRFTVGIYLILIGILAFVEL